MYVIILTLKPAVFSETPDRPILVASFDANLLTCELQWPDRTQRRDAGQHMFRLFH